MILIVFFLGTEFLYTAFIIYFAQSITRLIMMQSKFSQKNIFVLILIVYLINANTYNLMKTTF